MDVVRQEVVDVVKHSVLVEEVKHVLVEV